MEDYPRTIEEFDQQFSSEEKCRDYLFYLRWPNGYRCPRCQNQKAWPVGNHLFECASCKYQVSMTAGTIFQDTHKPLTTWFRAVWLVTSQKTGVSALSLKRILGLGSYKTAWTWLHKLRRAMVRPDRDRLSGRVEVDDTYIGGVEEGLHGRQRLKKVPIVVAAEEKGRGIGRIRMRLVEDLTKETLHNFIMDVIEPGSVIHTDGWKGYLGLNEKGYTHEVSNLKGKAKNASKLLPRVHRVASLLKRWFLGTMQGSVSNEHMEYYLDEYTFRFNRRHSKYRGKLFYRLLQQAAQGDPTIYSNLVKKSRQNSKTRKHNI